MKRKSMLFGAVASIALASAALAAGYWTNGVPVAGQSPYTNSLPLTGNETIPADTNLAAGAMPQSIAVKTSQLADYMGGLPSRGNALIGGNGDTNLWTYGTAGTSTTSATVAWDSANRWGQWATSSAGVKIAKDTTAADLPSGYGAAIALTHTATTAGQICMGQAVETSNSYQFDGQTAEFDFHAATGSGYTGGATLTAYITYGTGTDEGLNKMAYTVNGGGATGWTGGVNAAAAVVPLSAVSSSGRFAAIASIPSTATEIGVALCYTTTTADTSDYVAFDGLQLVRNPTLSSYASSTAAVSSSTVTLTSFERRTQAQETALQQRYAYSIKDDSGATYVYGMGQCKDTTSDCVFIVPFPVTMRTKPTGTASASTAFGYTATAGTANDCTSSDFTVVSSAATTNAGEVECSAGSVNIAGGASRLVGKATPSNATVIWSAEL